jgi:CHAD domain
VREAELELKAGDAEGLLLAAQKLLAGHELKLSTRSKAERGYRLALQKKGTSAEPEKARAVRLARKDTCAKAFAGILQSASSTAWPASDRRSRRGTPTTDRAAPPAKRAARLAPACRPHSLRAFERSARDMGRCVGTLRDADVLISDIHAPVEAAASDKTGFAELLETLTRERQRRQERRSPGGAARTFVEEAATLPHLVAAHACREPKA